jgi:REP element-mobilizing transposase RayT
MAKKLQASQPDPGTEKELPWLLDINRAVQILTGLSLGFSAQAALIMRNDVLWAYAGQLPQEAAKELGQAVNRYWDESSQSDLVRFIRLEATSAEHKMYATHLANGMVLSLVFEPETPFSTIRTQAGRLVRSLSTSPSNIQPDNDIGPVSTEGIEGFKTDQTQVEPQPESLSTNLPENATVQEPSRPTNNISIPQTPEGVRQPTGTTDSDGSEYAAPSPISDTGRRVKFEQTSQAMYNLNYACLLIPRFPTHRLAGDLSLRLAEWLPSLCIAYAWRLEFISVRPDYLQWIVNVPPTTAPGYLMRVIRNQISEKVFLDFPRLRNENPSGDFWAPGYVILGSNHPHPNQLVTDFIQQTRARQGIS